MWTGITHYIELSATYKDLLVFEAPWDYEKEPNSYEDGVKTQIA